MKLATHVRDLESNLPGQVTKASIAANAKMFRILSDKVYSDKPTAILRELGANAADAHLEAGIPDKPFHVTLPTPLDPILRIRDFGMGMSEDFIRYRWFKYGDTTKGETNDIIGGLGLGGKSPLAYTDSFQLTSWHAGECKVYIVYFDQDGEPALNLVHASPSDETGVELLIPIKADDFSAFREAAAKTYAWFDPLPKINTPIAPIEWLFKNEIYGIRKTSYYSNPLVLLMGPITYPVNRDNLRSHFNKLDESKYEMVRGLFDTQGLCLFSEIGSVDITPSREALSYDSGSVTKLLSLLSTSASRILKDFETSLEDCTTFTEAQIMFRRLVHQTHLDWDLIKNATWRGQQLDKYIRVKDIDCATVSDYDFNKKHIKLSHSPRFTYSDAARFNFNPPVFYYRDDPKINVTKLLKHNEHQLRAEAPFVVVFDPTPAQLNNIRIAFDDLVTIKKLSTLPQVPKKARVATTPGTRAKRPTGEATLFNYHGGGFGTSTFNLGVPLEKTAFVYRFSNDGAALAPDGTCTISHSILNTIVTDPLLLQGWRILLIPYHHTKTLREIECPPLMDVLRDHFKETVGTYLDPTLVYRWNEFVERPNPAWMLHNLLSNTYHGLGSALSARFAAHPLLTARDLIAEINDYRASLQNRVVAFGTLPMSLRPTPDNTIHDKIFEQLNDEFRQLINRYPLLAAHWRECRKQPNYRQPEFPNHLINSPEFLQYILDHDNQENV